MPFTYLLKCNDGTYYTGWTVDLEQRLKKHNQGTASKYTRSRLPVGLVYWEEYKTRSEAQKREATLRKLSRKYKESLIESFKTS
ncbi:GIY-YIG nuclease family protein [Alkaliphilus serpentinus]|uniref:GIY-YIG nuclease family protein n=1 Tax=Alkaliphilus serpentinus TaxID=1482731 RepID=A0A833M9S2_9FIRM|nr:GIY-YIG nuclease family protein [Alkaliphilus serpentinus]KAB3529204.1 GIY-YIG nuclease family protein [Alkaliphilus serpentinus]